MNEALMKLRKRRSHRTISLDEPLDAVDQIVNREITARDINPEQQYSKSELNGVLERALESLRPKCRTVFVLRDVEELSIEQTAEALGISVPAVKSRLLRARLMLRERLARHCKSSRTMASSVLPG